MKSGYTLIELIFVVIFTIVILGIGGCVGGVCWVGCKATKAVNEKGVKGIAVQVWEGTNANEKSSQNM
jgi:hypothetical protein